MTKSDFWPLLKCQKKLFSCTQISKNLLMYWNVSLSFLHQFWLNTVCATKFVVDFRKIQILLCFLTLWKYHLFNLELNSCWSVVSLLNQLWHFGHWLVYFHYVSILLMSESDKIAQRFVYVRSKPTTTDLLHARNTK